MATPDTFASQILSANHQLLGRNLVAAGTAKVISVFVGDVQLPSLPAILSEPRALSRRQQAKLELQQSSTSAGKKASIVRDYIFGSFRSLYFTVLGRLGIGAAGRDYSHVEWRILRILKTHRFGPERYAVGQTSYLPLFLSRLPLPILPYAMAILPALPSSTGPGLPSLPKAFEGGNKVADRERDRRGLDRTPTSASSSDHELGEDLASSIHTGTSNSSRGHNEGYESSDGNGLDGSWVGLDASS